MRANMVCSSTSNDLCRWASSVRVCELGDEELMPRRIRISPSFPSLSYARITVLGLTCSVTASSRIGYVLPCSGQRHGDDGAAGVVVDLEPDRLVVAIQRPDYLRVFSRSLKYPVTQLTRVQYPKIIVGAVFGSCFRSGKESLAVSECMLTVNSERECGRIIRLMASVPSSR